MLNITMREGDYIMIGDDIKIHFAFMVSPNTMDLAVEAPREVTVLRGKLRENEMGVNMLHLTLKVGEHVMIGDNICVKFNFNKGRTVASMSIEAPREVDIVNGKIYEERVAEKASSGDREAIHLMKQIAEEKSTRNKFFSKRKGKRQSPAYAHAT